MDNGNEPAYPALEYGREIVGLTKREHFAAMAMQGLLSNLADIRREDFKDHEIEEFAVMRADALLAELAKDSSHAELRKRLRVTEGALDDGRDHVGSALTCYNRGGKLCQLCLDRLELFCSGARP